MPTTALASSTPGRTAGAVLALTAAALVSFAVLPAIAVDAESAEYSGEPISLSLENAELREALARIAELADLRLEIEPGVKGTITVDVKDVPWDQVLRSITRIQRLEYRIEDGVIEVFKRNVDR